MKNATCCIASNFCLLQSKQLETVQGLPPKHDEPLDYAFPCIDFDPYSLYAKSKSGLKFCDKNKLECFSTTNTFTLVQSFEFELHAGAPPV